MEVVFQKNQEMITLRSFFFFSPNRYSTKYVEIGVQSGLRCNLFGSVYGAGDRLGFRGVPAQVS